MSRAPAILLGILLASFATPPANAQYEAIVERARPSVVLVAVETQRGLATGTGFFIHADGYIATARHVIENANRIVVLTPDGRQLEAIVITYSNVFDSAIIKVEGAGYPVLPFGDSDSVRQGQEVLVVGYPFATRLGRESVTVTRGIVSALRPSEGLIQIDAAINPGNSGGPVLNSRGEVIGLAVARLREGQLINFAVAANLVRTLTTQLSPVAIPAPGSAPPPSAQPTPPPSPPPTQPSPPPGGPAPFASYQIDSLLTQTYQTQLDTFGVVLSDWNRARGALNDGRFVDVQAMPGAFDLLVRIWAALEGGQLGTVRTLEGQIGQLQPRAAVAGLDGQNWVAIGFLYTDGSWNGIRFSKPDRVRQNFDQIVTAKLMGLLNQAPKAPQLAGILMHYSYAYYRSVRPTTHFGEEVQFRIPAYYMEQFLTQRITTEQLLGATNIIVKSQDDQVAQRLHLGTTPPPPPTAAPQSPPSSPPAVQPTPPPETSQAQLRVRALREIAGGKEIGVLMIGDVVVFRISTTFEGKSSLQRAEIVAEKLNRLLGQGLKPEEVRQGFLAGRYIIAARDEVLVTIDEELARNNGTSPPALAALWAKRIQDAMQQLR